MSCGLSESRWTEAEGALALVKSALKSKYSIHGAYGLHIE